MATSMKPADGSLTLAEKLLGLKVDDPHITAFTAVIQMGAIAAVLLYFAKDIWAIASAWVGGLFKPELRGTFDHRIDICSGARSRFSCLVLLGLRATAAALSAACRAAV